MSQKLNKGKKDKNDPSRFQGEGVNFRAKLIGIDDVESARGDKMCQDSLQKLKAVVKASGEHKQRILVNVSLEGLTLIDDRTKAINHNHAVHRISFISRDVTDNRAFGYIYGVGDGTHKFFAIKTLQAAEFLVLTLRDLFQCVYELKKQEMEDAKSKQEVGENSEGTVEAQKEGGDNIYQVPTNGAPVEGKEGESIYQVPGSNEPVINDEVDSGTGTANLLDLENELQSLQAGIQQIDTFEDLFPVGQAAQSNNNNASTEDPWGAPTAATTTTQGSSSGFGDDFGTTTSANNNDPFNTAFSTPSTTQTPFSTATTAQALSAQLGQMNFSNVSSSPFQTSHAGPTMAHPGAAAFGAGFNTAPTSVNPLAGLSAPSVQPGFGHPAFGAVPVQGGPPQMGGPPVMGGGMFGAPVNPAMGFPPRPAAADANPFSTGGFGIPAPANPVPSGDLFGGAPVLMPMSNNAPPVPPRAEEDDHKPRSGSDLFGDLCEIVPNKSKGKSPKELFEEQKAEPKRTLNELKVVPPAQTAQASLKKNPTNFPSSKTNGFCETPDHFEPFPFNSDDQTFPVDPFHPHKPDSSSSHFLSQLSPTFNSHSSIQSPHKANGGFTFSRGGDDEFDLPSPLSPPPPLPREELRNGNVPPPPPPPRRGVTGLKSIPRPRSGKSNTTTHVNKTVNGSDRNPAILNFAVSNPFDDPFFTNGDLSSAPKTVITKDSPSSGASNKQSAVRNHSVPGF